MDKYGFSAGQESGPGFRSLVSRAHSSASAVFDLTPLVDVVFLLLIFFMLTASFTQRSALDIELPQSEGSAQNVAKKDKLFVIQLQQNGKVLIGKQLYNSLAEVPLSVLALAKGQEVQLEADKDARHEDVVRILQKMQAQEAQAVSVEVLSPR